MNDPYKGRYCKDCVRYSGNNACHHGYGWLIDPVSGGVDLVNDARKLRELNGTCGPEGRLYERKE